MQTEGNYTSFYDLLKVQKSKFKCDFVFDVNKDGVIAVASILPSGSIIDIHLIRKVQG